MQRATTPPDLGLDHVTHVIVVEKETMFSQIYQMDWFDHSPRFLIVTAKGYPDFGTL